MWGISLFLCVICNNHKICKRDEMASHVYLIKQVIQLIIHIFTVGRNALRLERDTPVRLLAVIVVEWGGCIIGSAIKKTLNAKFWNLQTYAWSNNTEEMHSTPGN